MTNHSQSPQTEPKPEAKKPNSPFKEKPLPLDVRVGKLEESHKELGDVVNKNAEVMGDCLQITEARQWMIMRAMDDMSLGKVVRTEHLPLGENAIDWEHYKVEYIKFQEQLQAQAALTEAPPAEDESGIPTDAVVFGGEGG